MDMDIIVKTMPRDGILHLKLNRPAQLNALSREMLTCLSSMLAEAKQNNAVKAVLLTGEGKAFCAGADIKELAAIRGKEEGIAFADFGQKVMLQLECLGKPSLAAIHGFALGGGCELAMAASIRLASDNTMFAQPEIKLGVIPGFGGTQRLSRLIGKGRALSLCLTGKRFSANEALDWGLVTQLCTPETLYDQALAVLSELTQLPPIAMQSIMSVIDQGYNLPLTEALALEAAHFGLCCATQDKQEGVSAFLEKRSVQFTGN